eukprot:990207-Alexandrium_andersonii.AAC.1
MSASLVGSEMCIRDSLGLEQLPHPGQRQGPAPSSSRVSRAMVCSHMWHCLLYTSDAADDM